MSGNRDRDPVSRYTFDLFRDGLDQYHDGLEERLRQLEQWRGDFERAHGTGRSGRDLETRERRKWSWPEVIAAVITAGGVIAAATITAFGR